MACATRSSGALGAQETVRHYSFTLNRLIGSQRHPYRDVDTAVWPAVTVLIPAHDEEAVIEDILRAVLAADYPPDRLTIMPIDDRSEGATGAIIEGMPGKAAVLRDATERVETDVVLVFDSDYVPGVSLLKQLVAAFFDPEVGAGYAARLGRNPHTSRLDRHSRAGSAAGAAENPGRGAPGSASRPGDARAFAARRTCGADQDMIGLL